MKVKRTNISSHAIYRRVLQHAAFWLVASSMAAFVYGHNLPDFKSAFGYVMMLVPGDMLYFYLAAYWAIPLFFYRKEYLKFFFAFLACALAGAFVYRSIEILWAEDYLFQLQKSVDATVPRPVDLTGNYLQRIIKVSNIYGAFAGTNVLVWVALFLKFAKMWVDKRQAAAEAELSFLKSQIHPHFLFNTLNNLYALTLQQSPQSPAVVMGLSQILRYMLYECKSDTVLLKRDIEILNSYVELEKIRYEERLDFNFSIRGKVGDQEVPPLMMLPLVENAFKHGISETVSGAFINIDLQIDHRYLIFKVTNSKPEHIMADAEDHFGKIGLSNVYKRLDLLHKPNNQLYVYDEPGIYVAILELELI